MDINFLTDFLLEPRKTFKKEKKRASLKQAIKYVVIAGAIAGVFQALFLYIKRFLNVSFRFIFCTGGSILLLLLFSKLAFIFANIFKGKGDFITQTYFLSLSLSPAIVLLGIFGSHLGFLALYFLYPLTIALRETHGYSTSKAFLNLIMVLATLAIIREGVVYLIRIF